MSRKFNSIIKTSCGVFILSTTFFIGTLQNSYASSVKFAQTINKNNLPKPIYQNSLGTFYEELSNYNVTTENFNNQLTQWFDLDSDHSFEKVREFVDEIGYKHETFQHIYKGLKVENDLVFVHSKSGKVTSANGQMVRFYDFDISFDLTDEEFLNIAITDFNVNSKVKNSEIELVITKIPSEKGVEIIATKKVKLNSFKPIKSYFYFINPKGEIVKKYKAIHTADLPGSGTTYYRGTQNFTVDSFNGQYRLKDNFRNIHTLNAANLYFDEFTWEISGSQDFLNTSTSFTAIPMRPAVEVHWGMSKTYDYYKNVHNRNSYDGLGSIITNYYNFPEDFEDPQNAFAADFGDQVAMFFGIGGNIFNPVVGIDVAGHEFSHLVIGRNGNGGLEYLGESGALNESFADIFGTSIEFYVNLSPNWTIGEGVVKPFITPSYLRNMSNPNDVSDMLESQQPDTYTGTYWADPTDFDFDNGGVHINSGVGNFWFYLLSDQTLHTGTNDLGNAYSVQGIGINKAEKIVYKALMEGLTPSATYFDAFNATRQAALALYGPGSNEHNQLVNAWYAVGVGPSLLSVDKNELKVNLSVYPNPTKDGKLNIESQLDGNATVQVYDLLGKQVSSVFSLQQGSNQIDIPNLSNGIYFLVFKSEGKTHTEKLIKN